MNVEVADAEVVDAVAATEGEILELLARLVEAPKTLGREEPARRSPPRRSRAPAKA